MSSLASASPSALCTSNTNETTTGAPSAPAASKNDSAHAGGASRTHTSPQEEEGYYFCRNGKWFFRTGDRGPNPEDVVLLVNKDLRFQHV